MATVDRECKHRCYRTDPGSWGYAQGRQHQPLVSSGQSAESIVRQLVRRGWL